MTTERTHRDIPMEDTAARILDPETYSSLIDFYSSDALKKSTDKGEFDPAKQRGKFVRQCLKETPDVAEYLLSRMLWHHGNETIKLENWRDFQFITGLLQFDNYSDPRLTREQEIAFLKTTKAIYSAKGAAGFTRTYGNDSIGTWMMDEELIRYAMDHPESTERIRAILRDRGVLDAKEMISLVESSSHDSLLSGSL
jgi:hypothetical protein